MLGKLLALAIIAGVAYLALTQGVPWLKDEMAARERAGEEAGESQFCLEMADRANDTLGDEMIPAARPPVDASIWGTVLVRTAGDLAAAERACSCATVACAKASEAIREMRSIYHEFDDLARGNPMGLGSPARRQERVYQLLAEARSLARSE